MQLQRPSTTTTTTPTPKKRHGGAEPHRSIFALSGAAKEKDPHGDRGTQAGRRGERGGGGILPFGLTLSPSRSSRLSPAPKAPQSITISWISSAWLPGCCSARVLLRLVLSSAPRRWSGSFPVGCVSVRGRFAERLRRGELSSVGRSVRQGESGGSRKHPANIGGVRGQRLADSDPIKRRLGQPGRRAGGAGSESSRAVRFPANAGWRG